MVAATPAAPVKIAARRLTGPVARPDNAASADGQNLHPPPPKKEPSLADYSTRVSDAADLAGQHILLVEDSTYTREVIKKVLAPFGNPKVTEAATGRQALDMIEAGGHFTLILADFQMPVMNGLELVKAVRCGNTPLARNFPIMMLTGLSEPALMDHALALDISAFVIKPVSSATLGRRLTQVVGLAGDASWLQDAAIYAKVPVDDIDPSGRPMLGPDARDARFVVLADVQDGARLAGDLRTAEGGLLMAAGTVLTQEKVEALRRLSDLNMVGLDPAPDGMSGSGIFIANDAAAGGVAVKVVDLVPGKVLAADLRLTSGQLCLRRGTMITLSLLPFLQDLREAELVGETVQIEG